MLPDAQNGSGMLNGYWRLAVTAEARNDSRRQFFVTSMGTILHGMRWMAAIKVKDCYFIQILGWSGQLGSCARRLERAGQMRNREIFFPAVCQSNF
ncbi:hypothetical protein [Collimonas silvisoli]|uniref:hypothetical protein n=1 Tax=Collimonas silvisoli TaxID=2825884 RepID=UPI001B8B5951|nr:hypothetical protein [Collimonas silvisoli]